MPVPVCDVVSFVDPVCDVNVPPVHTNTYDEVPKDYIVCPPTEVPEDTTERPTAEVPTDVTACLPTDDPDDVYKSQRELSAYQYPLMFH